MNECVAIKEAQVFEKKKEVRDPESCLLSRIMLGNTCEWKGRLIPALMGRQLWKETDETMLDVFVENFARSYERPEGTKLLGRLVEHVSRPRIRLTHDAVNKAFGEGAWDVLSRAIVEL